MPSNPIELIKNKYKSLPDITIKSQSRKQKISDPLQVEYEKEKDAYYKQYDTDYDKLVENDYNKFIIEYPLATGHQKTEAMSMSQRSAKERLSKKYNGFPGFDTWKNERKRKI